MVKLTPGGTSVVSYSSGKLEITLNSDTRVEGAVSVGYRTGTKVNWDIVKTATDATRVRVSSGKDEVTLKPGSTAEISFSIYPSVTNIVSTLTYSATKPGGRGLTGGFTDTSAITVGPSANGASKVVYQFNASKDATPASSPVITTWTLTCE